MKKVILFLFAALLATVSVDAQQIAVVAKDGVTTTLYETLKEAIEGASAESVVYLPGGSFTISDEVKINKRLHIIGIGHNAASDNVDGRTHIAGNLFFVSGSDWSSVMGCYINGSVNIGSSTEPVHHITVRYCNINGVQVNHNECIGTVINQNLIRGGSDCHNAAVDFLNNILPHMYRVRGGRIMYNVTTTYATYGTGYFQTFNQCSDCIIEGNVILDASYIHSGSNCQVTGNMRKGGTWGSDPCDIGSSDWGDVFENNAGISVNSNYHFKEAFKNFEGKVGIYGGSGFTKTNLPPVPYIFMKSVPDKTDATGKLHINIAVKAGTSE